MVREMRISLRFEALSVSAGESAWDVGGAWWLFSEINEGNFEVDCSRLRVGINGAGESQLITWNVGTVGQVKIAAARASPWNHNEGASRVPLHL